MNTENESTKSRFPDFESFTAQGEGLPPYNNFVAFFWKQAGSMFRHYRGQKFMTEFKRKHKDIDRALTKLVTELYSPKRERSHSELKAELEPLLFVAYRMMEASSQVQKLLAENKDLLTQ